MTLFQSSTVVTSCYCFKVLVDDKYFRKIEKARSKIKGAGLQLDIHGYRSHAVDDWIEFGFLCYINYTFTFTLHYTTYNIQYRTQLLYYTRTDNVSHL